MTKVFANRITPGSDGAESLVVLTCSKSGVFEDFGIITEDPGTASCTMY